MHLQVNMIFALLTLGNKVTWNVGQYPLHHVTYASAKFEAATSNGLGEDAFYKKIHYLTFDLNVFDLWPKVTRNVAQYPLHHVTYAATKFEVAMSNGLGGPIHLQET